MAGGVITLGEMRAKGMTMLEVACRRCERRGRLRIERLIAEHGSGVLDLCAIIAADCPRMREPLGLDLRPLQRALSRAAEVVLIAANAVTAAKTTR